MYILLLWHLANTLQHEDCISYVEKKINKKIKILGKSLSKKLKLNFLLKSTFLKKQQKQ